MRINKRTSFGSSPVKELAPGSASNSSWDPALGQAPGRCEQEGRGLCISGEMLKHAAPPHTFIMVLQVYVEKHFHCGAVSLSQKQKRPLRQWSASLVPRFLYRGWGVAVIPHVQAFRFRDFSAVHRSPVMVRDEGVSLQS